MTRQKFAAFAAFAFLGVFATASAWANVSLKNGNFFIAYTDIFYPGGFEPKIERVYNSKTPFSGMFGAGWGNEYEVYLSVSADGSIVVHEYGGGAENRFIASAFKKEELDKAVDMIAAAAEKAGALGGGDRVAAYKKRLRSDALFRNEEWENYRKQGKLQARQLPVNTKLQSNRFSYQYVTRIQGGYVRTFDNGRVEHFDDAGRLTKVQDKNNNTMEFSYGKDGHLAKVVDNFNRKMFFYFNSQGFLERIEGENGKKAEYKYNSSGELVSSHDVDGNTYTFKYDSAGHHNMTEIGYSDKTTMQMVYYGADKHENIKSVKERDGTQTEYTYEGDHSAEKGHFAVGVLVKSGEGKKISSSNYEYFIRAKADGEEWTYKLNTTLDGDRTETTYNECCGLPLQIKHGGEETLFEYDTKGHVTKKTTPTEITNLAYDPNVGKVTKVARYSKLNKKQINASVFTYDSKGNLVTASNSDNKKVRLIYDGNGRISTLIDQNKRQIRFKYNENSKPIEISDPALGSITVTYTNSGEIKKVDSTAGRKIALQVTSAFQNLLDIIRPAGVNLSF
jgi:YD repeat-containing protein